MNADNVCKIAVLIDGENVPAKHYASMEKSIHQLKHAAVKRVYGDFSNGSHVAWLGVCKEHAVEPILHLPIGTSKNGTDMAITIAAMDLMASGRFDTVFIVSDDCDYIPLVRRLRNEGISVHGAGLKPATAGASALYNSWTVLKNMATTKPKLVAKSAPTNAAEISPPDKTPFVRIAAHKIAVHRSISIAKAAAPVKTEPMFDPLVIEFSKIVQAKLLEGDTTLSALGSWIRRHHPNIQPLLGPGKLKKLLIANGRFKVNGMSVSLAHQQKPDAPSFISH